MILITGATGLLGSRLLFDLVSKGHAVRALRRNNSQMRNLERYFSSYPELFLKIEWMEGDVTDIFSLEAALEGIDKVFHCAAKVSFQPSDNEQMHHINVEGTANVVNLALLHGIKKLCHVSSVAALGRTGEEASLDETANWVTSKHNSAYAISKYGAEREVWRGVAEGLDAVIINPGVIIGPGNWKTDSSMLFRQVWKGLSFYTSGVNGFVDVRDVSETMICLMESDIINERYVVVAESKKFRDVFDYIADKIGRKRPGIHAGPLLTDMAWKFELMKSWFTGSKPVITKETARSAGNRTFYSNLKIKNALQMEFRSVDKSIEDAAEYFLKENQVFQ